jgi:hypothetical protein
MEYECTYFTDTFFATLRTQLDVIFTSTCLLLLTETRYCKENHTAEE